MSLAAAWSSCYLIVPDNVPVQLVMSTPVTQPCERDIRCRFPTPGSGSGAAPLRLAAAMAALRSGGEPLTSHARRAMEVGGGSDGAATSGAPPAFTLQQGCAYLSLHEPAMRVCALSVDNITKDERRRMDYRGLDVMWGNWRDFQQRCPAAHSRFGTRHSQTNACVRTGATPMRPRPGWRSPAAWQPRRRRTCRPAAQCHPLSSDWPHRLWPSRLRGRRLTAARSSSPRPTLRGEQPWQATSGYLSVTQMRSMNKYI